MSRESENAEIFASSAALVEDYLQGLRRLSRNFNLAQLADPQIESLARWFCREALKLARRDTDWLCPEDKTDLSLTRELQQANQVQAVRRDFIALYIADKIVCAELYWRKACRQLRQIRPTLHARLDLINDAYLARQAAQQQAVQRARIGWVPKYLRHFADTVSNYSRARPETLQETASAFERAITESYDWTGRAYPRVDEMNTVNFRQQPHQDLSSYLEQIVEYRRRLDNDFAERIRMADFSTIMDRAASQRWYINLPR